MFAVWKTGNRIIWGRLVGRPYITSLWLGSLKCVSRLKGFCVVAWLCSLCCQASSEFRLTINGVKGFHCYLRTHSCVWRGQCYTRPLCLIFHGSHSNNHKHLFIILSRVGVNTWKWIDVNKPNLQTEWNTWINDILTWLWNNRFRYFTVSVCE